MKTNHPVLTISWSRKLMVACLIFTGGLISPVGAASDTDVTIIRAEKVVIEEGKITIIAEATTNILLATTEEGGMTWMEEVVKSITSVKSEKATFIIHQQTGDNEVYKTAWAMSLKAAKTLQEGGKIGRIGYYGPDINIDRNLIVFIEGFGYLYPEKTDSN